MGASKQRRQKFLTEHPICCFCGIADTATVDHVPPRAAFRERQFPEGFEFPACQACNSGSRQIEAVVSFYIRAFDQDEHYVPDEVLRLYRGIQNNDLNLLPNFDLSNRDKRRALRARGMERPLDSPLSELPLVGVPVEFSAYMASFSAKLTRALFYKELGNPVPKSHRVFTTWMDFLAPEAPEVIKGFETLLSNLTVGSRRNVDIGYQFLYLWGADGDDIFGAITQFSKSLFVIGAVANTEADGFVEFAQSKNWHAEP